MHGSKPPSSFPFYKNEGGKSQIMLFLWSKYTNAFFFHSENSQILYNDLHETIESLNHSQACLFTAHLAASYTSNTLNTFSALTFFPPAFLFPQMSAGWLSHQFTPLLKHCPLPETCPYHLILKCSANILPWHSLCHLIILLCLYAYQLTYLFVCGFYYHYLTLPIRT